MPKKERVGHYRIENSIYKRYKMICIEMELSITKQTADIIRQFVEIQEENIRLMKEAKKKASQ
jgi:hypothetical protein